VLANHHRTRAQTLQPGETLRLSWRVAAHDGSTEAADVPGLYRRYLAALEEGLLDALARFRRETQAETRAAAAVRQASTNWSKPMVSPTFS
jgi:hypothetical protein